MSIPAIDRIETVPFRLPFSTFLRSGLQMHVRQAENVLVRVVAEDGTSGFAEAMAFAELFGESQASIVTVIRDWIAPRVKGIALCDFERLWEQFDIIRNNPSAKAAVDIAVHDALARVLGVPLYKLLGGHSDRVPLTWIIGQGTVDEMVEEGLQQRDRGFGTFKIKIGLDPAKDVRVLGELRAKLGDDVELYVDANQAYTYTQAAWALPRMEEFAITIAEDPMQNWDTNGRRMLADRLSIPLLGDECVRTPWEMHQEVGLGILRMINVKPPRSGYYATRKIMNIAEQAGIECVMGTFLETDIGVLACAHFAGAMKAITRPAELTYWMKMKDRLLKQGLRVENGVLFLPDGPGLGADIDESKLDAYKVTI